MKGYVSHQHTYDDRHILDDRNCLVFEGVALTTFGSTAAKFGLVVITLERYFKIVHAIAHRKHYRNWMTSAGVALPWIGSTACVVFPGMFTTRIVNGECLKHSVWPNEAKAFVSMHLSSFL